MGLAGAMQAHFIGFIAPDNYVSALTFQVWAMLIVGGSGNNHGAILGAVLVWGLWSASARSSSAIFAAGDSRRAAAALQIVAIGVVLATMIVVRPDTMPLMLTPATYSGSNADQAVGWCHRYEPG